MFKFVSSKHKNWDHSQILFRLIYYPNFEVLIQKDETWLMLRFKIGGVFLDPDSLLLYIG